MKYVLLMCAILLSTTAFSQNNTSKGIGVQGYDLVAYFSNQALKGKDEFTAKYDGVTYKFSSQKNKDLFAKNPTKYLPQYGGWCAYAMGTTGEKVSINPETFEIRNGKLYLFYNKLLTNTLDSWLKEKPEKLIPVADKNWAKLKK